MKKDRYFRIFQVLSEVKEWAGSNLAPSERLDLYFSGKVPLELANIDFSRFARLEINSSLLAAEQADLEAAKLHLSRGFSRLLFYRLTEIQTKKGTEERILGSLDSVAHTMFGAVSTGSPQLAEPFYDVMLQALKGGYGVNDGHNPPRSTALRYAAFGLSIISDWLGQPLDLDAHALPRDPAWGQLVAHWREPDPDRFLQILLQACDTHVERIAVTEREANALSKDFEFNSVFLAVHPTEILAILRLRDLLGLPNPFEINHPLMQTPYAAITCRPGEVTERDELLERYLATVRQRDPHVLPPGL